MRMLMHAVTGICRGFVVRPRAMDAIAWLPVRPQEGLHSLRAAALTARIHQ